VSAALISPVASMARCSRSRTVVVAEDGGAKMDSLEAAEAETGDGADCPESRAESRSK
jgi:hypothetical protein